MQYERYVSDLYYQKEGLMIHNMQNLDPHEREITSINLQDYLPRNLRPMMHSIKLYHKGMHESDPVKELDVSSVINMKVDYNEDSDSMINLKLTVVLKPYEKLLLTYRINKMLRNFEEYPNDVMRGFNVPHMPVYYSFNTGDKDKIFSANILIQTPEPDFSMPFNVNAVTCVLFGSLFINTLTELYKNYREEKIEK